ncbi:MAG: hypothetical protein ACQ9MH_03190 [Nitrospinales bacterium]
MRARVCEADRFLNIRFHIIASDGIFQVQNDLLFILRIDPEPYRATLLPRFNTAPEQRPPTRPRPDDAALKQLRDIQRNTILNGCSSAPPNTPTAKPTHKIIFPKSLVKQNPFAKAILP